MTKGQEGEKEPLTPSADGDIPAEDNDGSDVEEQQQQQQQQRQNNIKVSKDLKDAISKQPQPPPPQNPRKPCCTTKTTISTILDWLASLLIATLVVTYWRGTWLVFDIYLCNQPYNATLLDSSNYCNASDPTMPIRVTSAWIGYIIGYVCMIAGMLCTWKYGLWSIQSQDELTIGKGVLRFGIVWILGVASINIWRGVWYLTDYLLGTIPSWVLVLIAAIVCMVTGTLNSILACPAIFLLDGPGYSSPPFLDTVLETKFSVTLPKDLDLSDSDDTKFNYNSVWVGVVDVVYSFWILPILVVWFWRGVWYGLDNMLWNRWDDKEMWEDDFYTLDLSLVFGSLIALIGLILGSKDILIILKSSLLSTENSNSKNNRLLLKIFKKVRALILSIATISFWRVIWYVWDVFLGLSTQWSAWTSHCLGVIGLVALGSFSCVTAPACTIGVDDIVHEDAADEPLFHDVPVPQESLFFIGIGRKPPSMLNKLIDEANTDTIATNDAENEANGDGNGNAEFVRASITAARRHAFSSSVRARLGGSGREGSMVHHKQDVFAEMTSRSYKMRKQTSQLIRSR